MKCRFWVVGFVVVSAMLVLVACSSVPKVSNIATALEGNWVVNNPQVRIYLNITGNTWELKSPPRVAPPPNIIPTSSANILGYIPNETEKFILENVFVGINGGSAIVKRNGTFTLSNDKLILYPIKIENVIGMEVKWKDLRRAKSYTFEYTLLDNSLFIINNDIQVEFIKSN